MLQNHCIDNFGSITASVLSEKPTLFICSLVLIKTPNFSNSIAISLRAVNLSFPT